MARDPPSPVMGTYRIFFVSDLHGSEVCFRKFLNSVDAYHPDALVYGGDILGKLLVPLFDDGRGAYHWYPSGEKGGASRPRTFPQWSARLRIKDATRCA